MTQTTPRRLADFAGDWRLDRRIEDALGAPARFEGRASWTPCAEGLLLLETGTLTIEGQGSFAAERRYLWADDLNVCFDDGRFFHQVPARGGDTEHWCDPDRYLVHYDFTGWPRFTTTWQVAGPRKSYRMVAVYTRD